MPVLRTRFTTGLLIGALATGLATATAASLAAPPAARPATPPSVTAAASVSFHLTPSSKQLAKCMPKSDVDIKVSLTTDAVGFDTFAISASGLRGNRAFTVFLLQRADSPFGAAEYIGDITTDSKGRASNQFRLIVQEAFSSTLVNGKRVRVDLNRVGMWFADPAGDDFCLGAGKGGVTPFDGDDEAGVQAFNSLKAKPLPAP
jgi:hypothetical protein